MKGMVGRDSGTWEAFKSLPLEAIVLESDAPYQFLKGCHDPVLVYDAARDLADLWEISISQVINLTTTTCKEFFSLNRYADTRGVTSPFPHQSDW